MLQQIVGPEVEGGAFRDRQQALALGARVVLPPVVDPRAGPARAGRQPSSACTRRRPEEPECRTAPCVQLQDAAAGTTRADAPPLVSIDPLRADTRTLCTPATPGTSTNDPRDIADREAVAPRLERGIADESTPRQRTGQNAGRRQPVAQHRLERASADLRGKQAADLIQDSSGDDLPVRPPGRGRFSSSASREPARGSRLNEDLHRGPERPRRRAAPLR